MSNLARNERVIDTLALDRVPPHNLEAEQSLLGAILLSPEALADVLEVVRPQDFYRETHRKIFDIIVDLFGRGEPVDAVTVAEVMKSRDILAESGGLSYLHTLVASVPTAANAKYYAHIVERNSVLRALISAATQIASIGYEGAEETESVIDKAESLIFGVAERRISEQFHSLKELVGEVFEEISHLYDSQSHIIGVPTGYSDLDEITSGLQKTDLIVIAARPSMGKTSLAVSIAMNVAMQEKIPVAIFSLEMSRHQLIQRMLCSEAKVDSKRLRSGSLTDEDWPRFTQAVGRLAEAPIFIDDTPAISALDIRAKARRLKAKEKLGLIIVDYLQLMHAYRKVDNRQQEIAEISRALKVMAKELSVPVIAISQLSRAVEQRADKKPQLSDLRESGAIEQDADVVIFIHRPEVDEDEAAGRGIVEVNVAKHRNGPTGTIKLYFVENYTKFIPVTKTPY